MQKCGFISILGLPNAGKSTLINALVGGKISIISSKPQTTRRRILGILPYQETQIIFVDTPGMVESKRPLEKAMNTIAWESGKQADHLLYVTDVTRKDDGVSHLHKLKCYQTPLSVVFNKVDLLNNKELLIEEVARLQKECPFIENFFMISALKAEGLQGILETLSQKLPESPWLFPKDQMTDLPQKLWAAEITREQLYVHLHQELPYQTYVETESWQEMDNKSLKIHQCIVVERDAQKGIVLGKGGSLIKKISQKARENLEDELKRRVHLFLYVKCQEEWSSKPWVLDQILSGQGY